MASTTDTTQLALTTRGPEGSRSARRLRREGLVPGVIYGGGEEPQHFAVDARILRNTLARAGQILEVDIEGATANVLIKDVQRHPVRGEAVHVDLLRVRMDETIHATVTLDLVGADDAPGVVEGGVFNQELRELAIEALPGDIPDSVTHDVSGLQINESLTVEVLTAPGGVTILDDPETVVASITLPRLEVEEPEVETETEVVGEGEGEAFAPEGAAAEGQPETGGAGEGEQRVDPLVGGGARVGGAPVGGDAQSARRLATDDDALVALRRQLPRLEAQARIPALEAPGVGERRRPPLLVDDQQQGHLGEGVRAGGEGAQDTQGEDHAALHVDAPGSDEPVAVALEQPVARMGHHRVEVTEEQQAPRTGARDSCDQVVGVGRRRARDPLDPRLGRQQGGADGDALVAGVGVARRRGNGDQRLQLALGAPADVDGGVPDPVVHRPDGTAGPARG